MLTFPKTTEVNKIIPKEKFYKNLTLNSGLKDKFVSDVKKIIWLNKLAPNTINIEKGEDITEILVLSLELKKTDFDYKIVESIARQNSHKILFVLRFEDTAQLAVFYNKLYKSEWQMLDDLKLSTKGLTLDKVWQEYIAQIADVEVSEDESLDENLEKQDEIAKLTKEIEKLEKKARAEIQPKKKFEMVQEVNKLQKELLKLK